MWFYLGGQIAGWNYLTWLLMKLGKWRAYNCLVPGMRPETLSDFGFSCPLAAAFQVLGAWRPPQEQQPSAWGTVGPHGGFSCSPFHKHKVSGKLPSLSHLVFHYNVARGRRRRQLDSDFLLFSLFWLSFSAFPFPCYMPFWSPLRLCCCTRKSLLQMECGVCVLWETLQQQSILEAPGASEHFRPELCGPHPWS